MTIYKVDIQQDNTYVSNITWKIVEYTKLLF